MEQDFVGTKRWIRQATPYEVYMEEQKLPIHRGKVGFYDIRDLALGSWKRMGAQGAFIELNGCGGLQGVYVIQVAGAGAITPEKHMYEEIFYVLNGDGQVQVNGETAPIHKGDGIPIRFNEAHSLVNNGSGDLELMVVGISAQKNNLDTELGELPHAH